MNFDNYINKIDNASEKCNELINILVNSCCEDLDNHVNNINSLILNNPTQLNNVMLDQIILNLPLLIYNASTKLEMLGIKDDLSNMEKKNKILEALDNSSAKLKSDRQIEAEIASMDIILLNNIYQRAYKVAKSKLDTAYEILASCKKIMSRRIEELKVQNSDTGRQILKS